VTLNLPNSELVLSSWKVELGNKGIERGWALAQFSDGGWIPTRWDKTFIVHNDESVTLKFL
jgi:hypothetical protein